MQCVRVDRHCDGFFNFAACKVDGSQQGVEVAIACRVPAERPVHAGRARARAAAADDEAQAVEVAAAAFLHVGVSDQYREGGVVVHDRSVSPCRGVRKGRARVAGASARRDRDLEALVQFRHGVLGRLHIEGLGHFAASKRDVAIDCHEVHGVQRT